MEMIDYVFENDVLFSWAVMAAALLLSVIVYFAALFLVRKLHNITLFKKFKVPLVGLKAPLRSLVPAQCLVLTLPMLRFSETVNGFFAGAFTLWLIASAGWFLIRIVRAARESVLSFYDISASDNLRARRVYTQVKVIENIIVFVIVLLTLAFILMSFEKVRQVGTGLLASAGVVGVVLGFAAQKTLGNFIAGIQIAFAQPIRLDDVVIVENEWGRIEEITLTYVVVRIWDQRRLVIPISYFLEKPFQNWTRVSADILGSVFIYADYTVPVDQMRAELTRILDGNPLWDRKVNVLQVTDAKHDTVELRALMSAKDSSMAWNLRCEVREQLLTFLQENYPDSLPKTRVAFNKDDPEKPAAGIHKH